MVDSNFRGGTGGSRGAVVRVGGEAASGCGVAGGVGDVVVLAAAGSL